MLNIIGIIDWVVVFLYLGMVLVLCIKSEDKKSLFCYLILCVVILCIGRVQTQLTVETSVYAMSNYIVASVLSDIAKSERMQKICRIFTSPIWLAICCAATLYGIGCEVVNSGVINIIYRWCIHA